MKARIQKAGAAFKQLSNLWNSKNLQRHTKFTIFNKNIRAVLLYGAEKFRTTVAKVQTIINTCWKRILQAKYNQQRRLYWIQQNKTCRPRVSTERLEMVMVKWRQLVDGLYPRGVKGKSEIESESDYQTQYSTMVWVFKCQSYIFICCNGISSI